MNNPREERAQRRFDRRMNIAAVILLFIALIVAGMYGAQRSQLASPDDGPVKFYWVIRGTEHGCLVLEKGTVTDCKVYTYDQLQHFPAHWEDPHVAFPKYFK